MVLLEGCASGVSPTPKASVPTTKDEKESG
jgi:hypothetical protein